MPYTQPMCSEPLDRGAFPGPWLLPGLTLRTFTSLSLLKTGFHTQSSCNSDLIYDSGAKGLKMYFFKRNILHIFIYASIYLLISIIYLPIIYLSLTNLPIIYLSILSIHHLSIFLQNVPIPPRSNVNLLLFQRMCVVKNPPHLYSWPTPYVWVMFL